MNVDIGKLVVDLGEIASGFLLRHLGKDQIKRLTVVCGSCSMYEVQHIRCPRLGTLPMLCEGHVCDAVRLATSWRGLSQDGSCGGPVIRQTRAEALVGVAILFTGNSASGL